METVSEMYKNRPSAASASAKPSSDCRMCVPWCCSKSSSARLAADRRAEFAEMPAKKEKRLIPMDKRGCINYEV